MASTSASTSGAGLHSMYPPADIIAASATGSASFFSRMWASLAQREVRPMDVWKHLLSIRASDKYSPLHIAVVFEDEVTLKAILEGDEQEQNTTGPSHLEKFDFLHARTSKGWTALHLAVVSGNVGILEVLMKAYDSVTKPETPWDFSDSCWMTPLHYTVLKNLQRQTELLLEWKLYGQHVNARDFFMRTPLHMAACHHPVSVQPFLNCAEVDLHAVDSVRHSPLHWAIYFAREEVVACLVEKLRDVEAIDMNIEDQSVWEIITGNVLVTLDDTTVSQLQQEHAQGGEGDSRRFLMESQKLMDRYKLIQGDVRTRIRSWLQMIPAVKSQADRMQKSTQMYVGANSAIIVSAALIASASFGRGAQVPKLRPFLLTMHILCISGALFFAIMALIASFVTLHSMAKVFPGRAQLKNIKFALKRITFLLGCSILCFLIAFYVSNFRSVSRFRASSILYHFFSGLGIMWCLLYVLVMPHQRDVNTYSPSDDRQLDLPPGYATKLFEKLYSENVRKLWHWRLWQTECEGTNEIRAFAACRCRAPSCDPFSEEELCNYYTNFLQQLFGVNVADPPRISTSRSHSFPHHTVQVVEQAGPRPQEQADGVQHQGQGAQQQQGGQQGCSTCWEAWRSAMGFCTCSGDAQRNFFSVPSHFQGLRMLLWALLKYLQLLWIPLQPLLFPLLWKLETKVTGVAFKKYMVSATFGRHFAEIYSHGRLYSSGATPNGPVWTRTNVAEAIWRQQDVPERRFEGFRQMADKVKHIESVYQNWSRDIGVNSPQDLEKKSRHFMFFLARLPRGILYWINIWSFPKSRGWCYRDLFYWLKIWFTEFRVTPKKFPIVKFYQGYIFQRDIEKRDAIVKEMSFIRGVCKRRYRDPQRDRVFPQ